MTCLEVRDRLTEHALGVLPRTDAREIDRHLERCAGCRKESSELVEGAATMALSLPSALAPPSLEDRILDRFRHYQPPGSQSWRWTLGPVGAAIVAASRGEPMPRPVAVRDLLLRAVDACIQPRCGKQGHVWTLFHDPTAVQHDNPVGLWERRQPVRTEDDRGPPLG